MTVLFVSQNPLERAENLKALFDAWDGPKEFRQGQENMRSAEREGFRVVVCDALPHPIEGKDKCKVINICHGMTGNKVYGADEDAEWFDAEAAMQTDFAIAASKASVPIVAGQLGIPEERVLPLGFPRTDAYFREMPRYDACFGTPVKRMYLYAPTFRDPGIGGWLPRIDWAMVDSMLHDGELMVVKRHYFTERELTRGYDLQNRRVVEVPPSDPLVPYLASCDVLLTDYSSCITDAFIMGKPVVLTVDDMNCFIADRPMYYPYPNAYSSNYLIAEGREEVLVAMLRTVAKKGLGITEERYRDLTAGACDGHSCERICELIRSLL